MNNRLQMCLLFVLLAIILCFLNSACITTGQPSAYEDEINQSESTSASAKPDLFIESSRDSQISSQSEPDYRTELEAYEQLISVHDSLQDYKLQLYGEGDIFTELSIVDPSTGAVLYEEHFDFDMYGILKQRFTVEVIDMDFDGYRDIDIFTGFGGNWKQYHIYIMWNPDAAGFVGDTYGLAELGLPSFDAEQEIVHSMVRASAADHWFYKHKYVEGKLVTIEEVAFNLVWEYYLDDSAKEQLKALEPLYDGDKTGFMHHIEKQLDYETMEMVIVENKYMLNTQDGDSLAEYASDSEIGLLLAQYETSSDVN